MTSSSKVSMFLICLNHCSAAYDCSMAKKRRAAEQALGVPVNKRKSLLMKPRHYSPNLDCREECDDRTQAEEEDGFAEASDHTATGSKRVWHKLYLLPDTKSSVFRIYSPCAVEAHSHLEAKSNIYFTQHPFPKNQFFLNQ